RHQLQDVDWLDGLLHALCPDAFFEHDQAEGTSTCDLGRAAVQREYLLDPPVVDALPDLFLHPHAAAAGAAAEATFTVVRLDLDALDAGDRVEYRARLVVNPVVPSEVTGVVVGDGLGHPSAHEKLALGDQAIHKLQCVHDLVVAP